MKALTIIERRHFKEEALNWKGPTPNLEEGATFWAHVFTLFWRALNLEISTIFRGAPMLVGLLCFI